MKTLALFIIMVVIPLWISYEITKKRNRTIWKAILATLLFGWWSVIILAIFLKTRDPKTGFLK